MQIAKANSKGHPLFNCSDINCPICNKAYSMLNIRHKIERENFQTDAVAPFVGRFGYPNVNLGLLAPPEPSDDSWIYEAPKYWGDCNYQIPKLVELRSSLINSRLNININKTNRFLEINQEIGMSSKPIDVEINLKHRPRFRINLDNYMAPHGPNASLEKAELTENPKIHTKVDKVFSDTYLKAREALLYLYDNDFDDNFLSRIMSVGILGLKKERKLVPTRWAITATHDMLGKELIRKIKDFNPIDYAAFFGYYLGNYYLILCFPDVWCYELFEMDVANPSSYMTDYEPYSGRKDYASNTAGGYYTVRLGIAERLNLSRKQGSILALRFITGDYTLPLGVWVTLEATRKAMNSKPINFSSKELMLEYAKTLAKKRFNYSITYILNKSILLRNIDAQKKLTQF